MEKWLLEQFEEYPIVRHVLYLMEEQSRVLSELKQLEAQKGLLEDRIYCAKEFLRVFINVK